MNSNWGTGKRKNKGAAQGKKKMCVIQRIHTDSICQTSTVGLGSVYTFIGLSGSKINSTGRRGVSPDDAFVCPGKQAALKMVAVITALTNKQTNKNQRSMAGGKMKVLVCINVRLSKADILFYLHKVDGSQIII